MTHPDFRHITTWVFDLDNTLYPPRYRLFDQIEVKMTDWVMRALGLGRDQADRLRQQYWDRYGTTLAGLMREHDIDPAPYLNEVHDIDFTGLPADPELASALRALPGRRVVYTNSCTPYAHRVLDARGLSGIFDAVYGVQEAGFLPKPEAAAFRTVFAVDGLDPTRSAMFEDDARNLLAPFQMGMQTVHIAAEPDAAPHIQHHAADLTEFLRRISRHG